MGNQFERGENLAERFKTNSKIVRKYLASIGCSYELHCNGVYNVNGAIQDGAVIRRGAITARIYTGRGTREDVIHEKFFVEKPFRKYRNE